jgi:hypothetical protein
VSENNKKQSELSELSFQVKAVEKGLIVSRPISDNYKYDLIVDNGIDLQRIQVKSCSYMYRKNAYKVSIGHGASNKKSYDKKMIDFYAVYLVDFSAWYIIPVEKIQGKKTLYLNAIESIYDEFKEAWNLLQVAS